MPVGQLPQGGEGCRCPLAGGRVTMSAVSPRSSPARRKGTATAASSSTESCTSRSCSNSTDVPGLVSAVVELTGDVLSVVVVADVRRFGVLTVGHAVRRPRAGDTSQDRP
jgi:hypothetical protein